MNSKITTENAPKAVGPYSQAILAGNTIYAAGQIPLTLEGKLNDGSNEEQIHQVMHNLEAVLKAAGVSFADVVKTTIYVTEMSLYPLVNQIYAQYLSEPFPARETVGVKELPLGTWLEISMIAVKTDAN